MIAASLGTMHRTLPHNCQEAILFSSSFSVLMAVSLL